MLMRDTGERVSMRGGIEKVVYIQTDGTVDHQTTDETHRFSWSKRRGCAMSPLLTIKQGLFAFSGSALGGGERLLVGLYAMVDTVHTVTSTSAKTSGGAGTTGTAAICLRSRSAATHPVRYPAL